MKKPEIIGILGGGQLARMSAFAAKRMGFGTAVLEKKRHSPAGQIADHELKGWVSSSKLLKKLSELSSVITLENEFVDYHRLEYLESLGRKVLPSPHTISLIQDKLIQKETLWANNIPVPKFIAVNHKTDYERIVKSIGIPFVLKSRKMGYDGYGNALIKSRKDFLAAFEKLTRRHSKLLAEEFIDFKMELAVMVVRTKKETKLYPVTQTIQKSHICHTVLAPAPIGKSTYKRAGEIAIESVLAVKGYGIFGVEMFFSSKGKILVNEMAPRPHNSGHYTIEGCFTSQFENHIRAVLNLPLGSTEMVRPHAVMINLLGKQSGAAVVKNYSSALKNDKVHLHIYGKDESRIGRKMGHITVIGDDADKILKIAKRAERNTII